MKGDPLPEAELEKLVGPMQFSKKHAQLKLALLQGKFRLVNSQGVGPDVIYLYLVARKHYFKTNICLHQAQ